LSSLKSIKFKILFFIIATLLVGCVYFYLGQNSSKTIDGSRLEYWSEAYQAFIDRPIFGQGPGNFFYVSNQFQNHAFTNTNYAHNSILEFLSTYGLIFSSCFFVLIFLALIYQKKHAPLNFILGFTGIMNSLYEASWNFLGIFCISIFFVFYNYPKLYNKNKSVFRVSTILKYFLLLFFLSKTLSDIAFINKKYLLSIKLDPFNINSRKALIDQGVYLKSNSFLINNYLSSYKHLIKGQLPQLSNLAFYHKIIDLNPRESILEYSNLSSYYYQKKDFNKLKNVLDKASEYIDVNQFSINIIMNIAKISYRVGLNYWNESNFYLAIDYFKKAVYFSQGWSHFQIELANAYWHTGQKDLAKNQLLVECQKYPESIFHCQQYLGIYKEDFLKPGSLDMVKEIESIDPNLIY